MKIYTKRGDLGETGLLGGKRLPKDDLQIWAYGTIDELNSVIGIAVSELHDLPLCQKLERIQRELFKLGAELAIQEGTTGSSLTPIGATEIDILEQEIDAMEATLAPLKNFILPGGSKAAACLHLARTVCRRAEREVLTLSRQMKLRPEVLSYCNRLSDYLFVCARQANKYFKVEDIPWATLDKET